MPDYCFYTKGKQTITLARSDVSRAADLLAQGYKKEVEEVHAASEKQAAARFADIRKNDVINRHNFLAGAGTMPWIGVLTAMAAFLFWRKK